MRKGEQIVNEEKLGTPWFKNHNVEGRNEMECGLGSEFGRRFNVENALREREREFETLKVLLFFVN